LLLKPVTVRAEEGSEVDGFPDERADSGTSKLPLLVEELL
jgi:hypothetical protein